MPVHTFWRGVGLLLAAAGLIVLLLAALQLNVNLSPFPTPTKDGQLITNGVYKYMRHPIYGGILLGAAGYSLNSADAFRLLVTLALFILFYFKSSYEEHLLKSHFRGYSDYKRQTGRFSPSARQIIRLSKRRS